jgi:tetratricopeptide (TPR) repeat protein
VTTASVEAYRDYAEGMELHLRGQEREALPKLEKAVEQDPDFAMALAKLAVVHSNLGDEPQAEDYGRRALEHLNRLTVRERYYIEGVFYSRQADTIEKAIAAYRMAVELFPDHTAARNNLAELLLRMGKCDEAIGHLEQLRREGVPFPATYTLLALAYAGMDQPEKGLEMQREFVRQHPANAAARIDLGLTLAVFGRYDDALAALDEADRLAPGDPDVARVRYCVFVLTDRWKDAETQLTRLEASPLPASRWQAALGRALLDGYAGRLEAAGASLERAIAAMPAVSAKTSDVRLVAADFLASLGEPSRGLQQARAALKAAKGKMGSGSAHAYVGIFLQMEGRSTEARPELEAARRLLGQVPGPMGESSRHELEGQLALAEGNSKRAIDELQKALAPLPRPTAVMYDDRHARIWYGLADAHRAAAHDREAAEWYRRVVEAGMPRLSAPGRYVKSLYRLGQIHERLGEGELARSFYRKYLSYWRDGTVDRPQVAEATRKLAAS